MCLSFRQDFHADSLFPVDVPFNCIGKGVKIYSANQGTGKGKYDDLIGYQEMLSLWDLETE